MLAQTLIILSALIFTAHADNLPGQSNDGKTLYCQAANDVSKGAYRMDAFTLSTQGTNLTMNITMESLVCLQTDSTFSWGPRIFTADLPTFDRDGNPITIKYK